MDEDTFRLVLDLIAAEQEVVQVVSVQLAAIEAQLADDWNIRSAVLP